MSELPEPDMSELPENQPAAVTAAPVAPSERLQTLDVLRGFALFGILFVNVTALAQPATWFHIDWASLTPVNYAVEVLKLFFTQGKFYTLFSFLFGLGFAVQLARAEATGRPFAKRFLWRMFLLLLIGLFHVTFLWDGDILNTYAVAGMILLGLFGLKRLADRLVRRYSKTGRQKASHRPVLIGAAFLIFGPFLIFGFMLNFAIQTKEAALSGAELTEMQQKVWEDIKNIGAEEKIAEREAEYAALDTMFREGTYIDTLSYRMENLPDRTISGPFWFMLAGIFSIGAFFGRNNFIGRAGELKPGFRKLLGWSLAIGAPLSAAFVWITIMQPEHPGVSWWGWSDFFTKTSSGLAFALAYVAAITLLMQTGARRFLSLLAPVGRTALSNYLLQSLIGTTVFYGYGLGLINHDLTSIEQVGYILLLFSGQVALSHWWVARFRFGPVEWLWRSLSYGKRQPMRVHGPDEVRTIPQSA